MQYRLSIDKGFCDVVKLVAALTVALHHYSQYVCANHLSVNVVYKLLSSQGGYLGVAVFFLLSGYGLMESETKCHLRLWEFIRRRFLKVYLPVVLVTALWLPLYFRFVADSEPAILSNGGGYLLIINDLLFGFRDGVLWFVKVLFMLYAAFFAFSSVYRINRAASFALLGAATIAITLICSCTMGIYTILSIPMFMVGVVASACKDVNLRMFNVSLAVLALSCLFVAVVLCVLRGGMLSLGSMSHMVANYIAMAVFIIACTMYKFKVRTPKFVPAISFDIYLVHNKILRLCTCLLPAVPLWVFVAGTAAATTAFYGIRRMLKI